MHIHILGICGTFMGGIAAIAQQAGHTVTGCDQNIYPPMSDQLQNLGIELHQGFDAEQIKKFAPDVFVIGNIMTRGMPVIEDLLKHKAPLVSGPQWLAEQVLQQQKKVIALAGTHGKTTTSSLTAWILEANGYEPGFLIGGKPQNFDVSARLGQGDVFVIEADEYDTAFFDKRSKFIHYRPDIAVLNNLEFDHADIFNSIADIKRQFHHLVKLIPAEGHLIVNHDEAELADVLKQGYWSNLQSFGTHPCDWSITEQETHDFTFNFKRQSYQAHSVLPGAHNQANLLAAICASHAFGVEITDAVNSAKQFKPPKRRLEIRYHCDKLRVYDDFAHHPTAIQKTIAAVRSKRKLITVFEPRSNSMRAGAHSQQLASAFAEADEIIIYQPTSVKADFSLLIQNHPENLRVFDNVDKIIEHLNLTIIENTDVIFMSNGGFENIINKYLQSL